MPTSQGHVIKHIKGDELLPIRAAIQAHYQPRDFGTEKEYSDFLSRLEHATSLELIVPMGESGAYAGGNCSSENTQIIEPDNQLDWIIRATLNVMEQSSDNKRIVYHESSGAIWLGCVNIVETVSSDHSHYDTEQLKAMLNAAKELVQSGRTMIFNVRFTICSEDKSPTMAHYETFFIRFDEEKKCAVYHRDSRFTLSEAADSCEDSLSKEVVKALRETGFTVLSHQREIARYNQNALSCGPSAVGEVMDFLIQKDSCYDGFLDALDGRGKQRCYDATSLVFKDAEGKPLTREVFMRLVQYYFVAREFQYADILLSLKMSVFNCFLREPPKSDSESKSESESGYYYPIPHGLLEEYARAAYPRLFNQSFSVERFSVSTSSAQREHRSLAGNISQTGMKSRHTSPREDFAAVRQSNPSSLMLWENMSSLLFHVITHPWTRYGMLIVYIAAIVGLCVSLSALSANPVALALIHGLTISTMGLTAVSGTVLSISGALTAYGFLSPPQHLEAGTDGLQGPAGKFLNNF